MFKAYCLVIVGKQMCETKPLSSRKLHSGYEKKHKKVKINVKRRDNVLIQRGITMGIENKSHFIMVIVV